MPAPTDPAALLTHYRAARTIDTILAPDGIRDLAAGLRSGTLKDPFAAAHDLITTGAFNDDNTRPDIRGRWYRRLVDIIASPERAAAADSHISSIKALREAVTTAAAAVPPNVARGEVVRLLESTVGAPDNHWGHIEGLCAQILNDAEKRDGLTGDPETDEILSDPDAVAAIEEGLADLNTGRVENGVG